MSDTKVNSGKSPGGKRSVRNAFANDALRQEKAAHNGLGRRERRRIASGKRKPNLATA